MSRTSTSTVVFTDIVESTQLRAKMGEDAYDGLRRSHDDRLGDVVKEHAGTVVKGSGDGLLCTFDAASDALASAVGMQQAIHQMAIEHGVELAIRIGVSIGDVTWESGDCFGMPVVEAARLESAADAGEILVSEYVKIMARGRGGGEFEERGVFELKGIPEPVTAFAVKWAPVRRAISRFEATPYVGRTRELDVLRDAWGAAAGGSGSTLFVAAEAGMGKTRLLDEFRAGLEAGVDEALILHGTCHSGETAPYAPLADAIGAWARTEPAAGRLLGDQAPVIAGMVPVLHEVLGEIEAPPVVEPDVERRRLHDALLRFLDRMAARAPVLLIVDDLHWIDLGTLAALRAIARGAASRAMLVVAAFRATDLIEDEDRQALLAEIEREATPQRIELAGLSTDDVRSLLLRMGDLDAVPDRFVALLTNRSSGNPLFIRETLLNIVQEGKVRRDASGEWTLTEGDIDVPSVLRHVIDRRLGQLGDDARALLRIGALFDAGFPLDAAAQVAGLAEDAALDAIDEALGAQVIEPTSAFDEYRFTHAMYRHVLADSHNPSRRTRLHRKLADALEKRLSPTPSPTAIAALVHQFLASAELPGADRGVPYALDRARMLARAVSFEEARIAYVSARGLMPEADERIPPTLLEIARLTALAGKGRPTILAAAVAARDAVRDSEGPDAAVEAIVEIARLIAPGDLETAWRLADLVRSLHCGARDETWVWLRGWELAAADWVDESFLGLPRDTAERRALNEVAFELGVALPFDNGFMASDAESARTLADGANPFAQMLILGFISGDFGRALEAATIARTEAAAAGDIARALFTCAIEARLHWTLGRFDSADEALECGKAYVDRMGDLSNPVLQYFGSVVLRDMDTTPDTTYIEDGRMTDFLDLESPDTNWLAALLRMGDIIDVATTDEAAWEHAMEAALPLITSTHGGVANYTMFVCWVSESMCLANRGIFIDTFEEALQERIIDRGFRYLDVCPLRAMGSLASLRGDIETARSWFARSLQETEADGRILVTTRTMVRAIQAELRSGSSRDTVRIDAMIDDLSDRVAALGLKPGWRPFVDSARKLNAGEGLPFRPPIR